MYLLWRVNVGLNTDIEYSFMTVGPTKFSCDRCFGSFKKKVNVTPMFTLYDVGKVCEESADCNVSQLVGTHDGGICVTSYDWASFLTIYFKKIPNVTNFQHFVFSKDHPDTVKCSVLLDDAPKEFKIFQEKTPPLVPGKLPDVISPDGFSAERETYLFNNIREFCKEGSEDLVASEPTSKRVKKGN